VTVTAARAPAATDDPLELASARFAEATAALRDDRELLKRIDTKFVCARAAAARIVAALTAEYAALRVPTGNVATYRSLYFDTPARRCFEDHRRGRRLRHKIRIRHYPDRRLTFLEVKTKRNEDVTDKHRVALPYGTEVLDDAARAFLRRWIDLPVDELRAVMRIEFRRLSLVGLRTSERVTLDLDLAAEELGGGRWRLGDAVVLEIKQAPFCVRTPVMAALRAEHLREQSISKYTVATAALHPELRCNRLRPELRSLERIGA
jgi:hypothetical protein